MSVIRKRDFFSRLWMGSMLGVIILCFLLGASHGQDSDRKYPDYYPDRFNAIGNIDRIAEDEIVIGDTLYGLSPSATYHTPTIEDTSKHFFSVGSLVGIITNTKHEVTSLWLIE